jgi:deoxyribodipyrimidine photo-lyase
LSSSPVLFWFRDDLRLADNVGLAEAFATGKPVATVFLLDEESEGVRPLGGAARWWLDKSLRALTADIARRGGRLILRRGPAVEEIARLVTEIGADAVYWNRRVGRARETDAALKIALRARGVETKSFNASLLADPVKQDRAYKVFSPFWRAAQRAIDPGEPCPPPPRLFSPESVACDDINAWGLHPSRPDWSMGLAGNWTPGEAAARQHLEEFLDGPANGYTDQRNRPDQAGTSRLSPHLRFGEIGPAQVWRAVIRSSALGKLGDKDRDKFQSEIGWREFSHHLLFHDPDMTRLSWRREFDGVNWRDASVDQHAWETGQTGYPIVDAGMRELWVTGWMHNRVRMIVGSFLVKHLLLHWRVGEAWFWDTLVDADEANNAAGWQWIAGTGADAAPYFRIFNPTLQGETYDPSGTYVRKWLPQLNQLPERWIHRPHEAPAGVLAAAGVELGRTYSRPLVDHAMARARALEIIGGVKAARKDVDA